MRRSTTRGRDGDYLVVDDRTGITRWRSECIKDWQGLIVHRSVYEPRHPQDFLRARREDFRIPDARPERRIEDESFVGPLVTEIADDVPGNNNEYAPMGPLGAFALGQTEDDFGDQQESNTAGSLSITVTSTRRMRPADRIGVILDSGDLFLTEIDYVTSSTTLQMTQPLPGSTSAGNRVFDYTAATSGSLG
jgi:hypothetical protein